MIRGSLQRIAVRVSGRQFAQLGACQESAAAFPPESSNVGLRHTQQQQSERKWLRTYPGCRHFSSDGPSSHEGTSKEATGSLCSAEDAKKTEGTSEEATTSAVEGAEGVVGAESASGGTDEDAAESAPPRNEYRAPEHVSIPDAMLSRRVIDHYKEEDAVQAFPINHAGEHSSGWQLYDVDDENTIVWWMLDLTGGRVPENEKNAQLSDDVKHFMYRLNKEGGWSVPQIAELFRVRQQRVMAIIALKEMEVGKRESGEELLEDLHEDMERVFECHEVRGRFERHVRLLPTKPAFEVIGTGGGGRKGKKGKGKGDAERVYESHEDPSWESEVRIREEEVAAHEERILVKEFRERLAFNLGKVGQSISNESRARQAPQRPKEGWSVVVRPAGRGVEFEPFVARPDGSRRPLSSDEDLYINRMKPLRRRTIL